MAHQSELIEKDILAFLKSQEEKSLLRFITCGSVDDGKSTLIGRLLWDSKMVFEDQLASLEADSRKVGTQGGAIDYALLLDGLQAEREQGITIDVAYRFFSIDPAWSWSIRRPWRSEVRVRSISWMMSGRVSASDSTAPVKG